MRDLNETGAFRRVDDPSAAERLGSIVPFHLLEYDFVLSPVGPRGSE